jgi:hypothetical protein
MAMHLSLINLSEGSELLIKTGWNLSTNETTAEKQL